MRFEVWLSGWTCVLFQGEGDGGMCDSSMELFFACAVFFCLSVYLWRVPLESTFGKYLWALAGLDGHLFFPRERERGKRGAFSIGHGMGGCAILLSMKPFLSGFGVSRFTFVVW